VDLAGYSADAGVGGGGEEGQDKFLGAHGVNTHGFFAFNFSPVVINIIVEK